MHPTTSPRRHRSVRHDRSPNHSERKRKRDQKRSQVDEELRTGDSVGGEKRNAARANGGRQDEPPLVGGLYDVMAALVTATASQQRKYEEMVYNGSTRAIIGPGFQVRELLFGEETVSFRVTATATADQVALLRKTPAHGELMDAMLDAKSIVEHLEIDTTRATTKRAATAAATTTPFKGSVNVHLTGKQHVAQFFKHMDVLAAVVSEVKVEEFSVQSPLTVPWHPVVIKDKVFAEFVSNSVRTYEFQATIAADIRKCFHDSITKVQQYADSNDVSWYEEATADITTPVHLWLHSSSRDALKRVEAALDAVLEVQRYDDPVFRSKYKSHTDWAWRTHDLIAAVLDPNSSACFRCCKKDRSMWVFGPKAIRRETVHRMKLNTLATLHAARRVVDECSVCHREAANPSIVFTTCRHTCCVSCILPAMSTSSRLPLCCPATDCGCELHMNDVVLLTKDVDALVETAVLAYVAKHPELCVVCPTPGCNQILSRLSANSVDQTVSCESCERVYCLACCDATGLAVLHHEGNACVEARYAGVGVEDHVNYIRNHILTLHCPHCKTAFYDSDGCLSVTCGNVTCTRHFCACCLDFSHADCDVTHAHVSQCTKNSHSGQSATTETSLMAIHRDFREQTLREYLRTRIECAKMHREVVSLLARELSDLGLDASGFQRSWSLWPFK